MTPLVSDPRLIRIYWLLCFYADGEPLLYVEGSDEMGWQLRDRTLWFYLGERGTVHLWDNLLGVAVAPNRETLKSRLKAFLRAE